MQQQEWTQCKLWTLVNIGSSAVTNSLSPGEDNSGAGSEWMA